jgi:hypothetical protein
LNAVRQYGGLIEFPRVGARFPTRRYSRVLIAVAAGHTRAQDLRDELAREFARFSAAAAPTLQKKVQEAIHPYHIIVAA